jgi:peptide-methionine (S)-S-oxide reductase
MLFSRHRTELPTADQALAGREQPWFSIAARHKVLDAPVVTDEVPEGLEVAIFGLGCFWGAEEIFWRMRGVWSTSVGYAGGFTRHPSNEQVCSGQTGHTEAVRVVFDPEVVSYADLVKAFYEFHDPTQGMRQGNDVGTQYRSAIYFTSADQEETARKLTAAYEPALQAKGYGPITTEIKPATEYYYAEDYHQQYLYKNPYGYRCHSATGVPFPD